MVMEQASFAAWGSSPFNPSKMKGCILTKGTVYQTGGGALVVFYLGCQHPGHEEHSPLNKYTDMLQWLGVTIQRKTNSNVPEP